MNTKSTPKRSGALTITRTGRHVFFNWTTAPAFDLLMAPEIVQGMMRLDLQDHLRCRRGWEVQVGRQAGWLKVLTKDAPTIEPILRRWLRRVISWPGAGRYAQAEAEVDLPQYMPAPGAEGEPLSWIEAWVEQLYRADDVIKFIVSDLGAGDRLPKIASDYPTAIANKLLHRFGTQDPMF